MAYKTRKFILERVKPEDRESVMKLTGQELNNVIHQFAKILDTGRSKPHVSELNAAPPALSGFSLSLLTESQFSTRHHEIRLDLKLPRGEWRDKRNTVNDLLIRKFQLFLSGDLTDIRPIFIDRFEEKKLELLPIILDKKTWLKFKIMVSCLNIEEKIVRDIIYKDWML